MQGLPYYIKFADKYPSVHDLAAAPLDDVLRLWQGLGYYSRARNMHQTAQLVMKEYSGVFPDSYQKLIKLKGIGNYTASAVASFASNENVAVVDGNVYRVLARLFGIHTDIASHRAKKDFLELATNLLPVGKAAIFNQAIMEFGAIQCVPKSPKCMFCPLNMSCVAFDKGLQAVLPVKNKKVKVKDRFLNYILISCGEKYYFSLRKTEEIWQGLYELYLVENETNEKVDSLVSNEHIVSNFENLDQLTFYKAYKHKLTHQQLFINFYILPIDKSAAFYKKNRQNFYSLSDIDQLGKPIIIEKFLKDILIL